MENFKLKQIFKIILAEKKNNDENKLKLKSSELWLARPVSFSEWFSVSVGFPASEAEVVTSLPISEMNLGRLVIRR